MNAEPDWNDLRYLLAVARAGSLAGAAREIGVRHSTVGRRLEALEHALGVNLVQRTPEGVELTQSGQSLVPLALNAEKAIGVLVATAQTKHRRFRLSTPTGLAAILAGRIAEFLAANPAIGIDVISSSRRLSFGRGEVDIAVMIGTVEEDSLVIRPVSEAGWALYAAEGYLAGAPPFGTAADLTRHRVLGLPPELSDQPAASWLREKAGEAIIPLNLSPISEVVAAAAESAGIALLPCLLADREPRLKRLLPDVLVVCHPVTLVYRPDIAEDRDGRLVLRTLAAALGEVSGAFRGEKAA